MGVSTPFDTVNVQLCAGTTACVTVLGFDAIAFVNVKVVAR